MVPLGSHARILVCVGVCGENIVNTNTWNLNVAVDTRVGFSLIGG